MSLFPTSILSYRRPNTYVEPRNATSHHRLTPPTYMRSSLPPVSYHTFAGLPPPRNVFALLPFVVPHPYFPAVRPVLLNALVDIAPFGFVQLGTSRNQPSQN